MSDENLTPETETTVVETAPVVETATVAAVEEVKEVKVKETAKAEPAAVVDEEEPVEVVAGITEAAALPGRGSMGIVSPETGIRVKL